MYFCEQPSNSPDFVAPGSEIRFMSVQSLHAEVNNWFRQTQMLHQSTFRLKLRVMSVAKLLPHHRALYSPTARSMPAVRVLAHALGQGLWTDTGWAHWTGSGKIVKKARLPLSQSRWVEVKKRLQAPGCPSHAVRFAQTARWSSHETVVIGCVPSDEKTSLQKICCRCVFLPFRAGHVFCNCLSQLCAKSFCR